MAEYAGWLTRLARMPMLKRDAKAAVERFKRERTKYVLFPLQLETDYQIRAHSPFKSQLEAIDLVLESFARAAPTHLKLLFKVHPLDNGLINWAKQILRRAAALGISDRVATIDGGDLRELLEGAESVVTINSTVGTAAMEAGKPLLTLGGAIYVVEGLTYAHGIDQFWTSPQAPDPSLFSAFVKALAGTIQVRGGFYERGGMEAAAKAAAKRLDELTVNEPGAYIPIPPRLAVPGDKKV
jgi:capsular polysaccharide export protein